MNATIHFYNIFVSIFLYAMIYSNYFLYAKILTKEQRFVVEEGETVKFQCEISGDTDDHNAVVWKRGDEVIAIDDNILRDDPRIRVSGHENNFELVIDNVEPYDTASYICKTTDPESSVAHHLMVYVLPSVKISPESSYLLVNEGENIALKCIGSGNPSPKIQWIRKNRDLPGNAEVRNGQLRLKHANLEDSGIYSCIGSNNVGRNAEAHIQIHVQSYESGSHDKSAPWVETLESFVPALPGQNKNLTCIYNAEPTPQIDWYFHSTIINIFDERFKNIIYYGTRHDNFSETILAIEDIQEENFGDYKCKVSNNLGTAEKNIHVNGRPGTPNVTINETTIFWEVESLLHILEYKIYYKVLNDDAWQVLKVIQADKSEQDGSKWRRSDNLAYLNSDIIYHIEIQARNTLGWGSTSKSNITLIVPNHLNKQKANFSSTLHGSKISWICSYVIVMMMLSFVKNVIKV